MPLLLSLESCSKRRRSIFVPIFVLGNDLLSTFLLLRAIIRRLFAEGAQ